MEMHKIVKKLEKKVGKIVTFSEIQSLLSGESLDRGAQAVYALKGMGVLESVRKGLYFVSSPETHYSLQDQYWPLLKTLIREEAGGEGIIASEKALEILLMDYSLPERIVVYTPTTNKRIRLSEQHEVVFISAKTGKKEGYKNLFPILKRYSTKQEIFSQSFSVLSPEVALLDTLTLHTHEEGVTETLVLKFLKRFHMNLNHMVLRSLVRVRYIRAINRLRVITQTHGYDEIYQLCLDTIKKEGGGCFVSFP